MISHGLTKVIFKFEEGAWHGLESESLWVEPVGHHEYRICNVPFYAKGVSYGDVVSARDENGRLVVSGVSARGGHSTYRVFLAEGKDLKRSDEWPKLEALGCTYERATERLVAIDVPSEVDVFAVYSVLEAGKANGVWDFEEGHCGHPIGS